MVKVKNKLLLAMSLLLCAVLLSAVFVFTKPQTENSIEVKAETRAPGLYKTGTTTFVQNSSGQDYTWEQLVSDSIVTLSTGSFKVSNSIVAGELVCGNVENLTSLKAAFENCANLASIDCSNLDTSNVTDMSWMFNGCTGLRTVDISTLNTKKVTTMYNMFQKCTSLGSITFGSDFSTENVQNMCSMFAECTALSKLDVSKFITQNVTDMSGMFYKCTGLSKIDVSNFNTSNVNNMMTMFKSCSALTELDLSSFDTSNVVYTTEMFYSCTRLTKVIFGTEFNTSKVRNMSNMFYSCQKLKILDLTTFSTETISSSSYNLSLKYCNSLLQIKVPSKMGSNAIELATAWFDKMANHYALTESPSTAITTITQDMVGKTIELYDANNNTLNRNEITDITVTNGKAYEYTDGTTNYESAVGSLTGTIGKVNQNIGVFDLVASDNADVTLKIANATVSNVDDVHIIRYNGTKWEDVTSTATKTYDSDAKSLTIQMTVESSGPVVVVEATPNAIDTPETGIVANSISILVAMVSLLGMGYVVSKKKRLSK